MKLALNKKNIGAFLLALLLLLIFCSKTIYAHNLPEIVAVKPQNGRLAKVEMSSGLAIWGEIERIYLKNGGICGELLVKAGDRVEAGQVLLRMDFHKDEAEGFLAQIALDRAKLQIDMQNIQLNLDRLEYSRGPQGYETQNLAKDINKAQTALADAQMLFEMGGISRQELMSAEDALQSLYEKQAKALKDYNFDAAALNMEFQTKQLELSNLSLQEEPYRRLLADFESYGEIKAPVSGQLITLNAAEGQRLNENTLLAEIGAGQEFIVECGIPLENNFVLPGDTCLLSNASHMFTGIVSRVDPQKQGKTISVNLASPEISAGETFDVIFEKESHTTFTLVPNGALNRDNEGYFLYLIKRREGILGKEYYLERLNVYIGDSDSKNTAIIKGISFFEPLLLASDQAVSPGDVVKLTNVGDFFED